MWSGNFITRNVTFRNIVMPNTRKGIYVKIDTHGNSAQAHFENVGAECSSCRSSLQHIETHSDIALNRSR